MTEDTKAAQRAEAATLHRPSGSIPRWGLVHMISRLRGELYAASFAPVWDNHPDELASIKTMLQHTAVDAGGADYVDHMVHEWWLFPARDISSMDALREHWTREMSKVLDTLDWDDPVHACAADAVRDAVAEAFEAGERAGREAAIEDYGIDPLEPFTACGDPALDEEVCRGVVDPDPLHVEADRQQLTVEESTFVDACDAMLRMRGTTANSILRDLTARFVRLTHEAERHAYERAKDRKVVRSLIEVLAYTVGVDFDEEG